MINSIIILQIISFITIIIFIDALNLQEDYRFLQEKYKSLQNTENILNNHFKDINLKLDILLIKFENKNNYNIHFQYKEVNKTKDNLGRNILFKSNSFTFKNKETIF